MGGGNWSEDFYQQRGTTRQQTGQPVFAHHAAQAAKPRDQQTVHQRLNPFGVKTRESCDSLEHPNSLAVGIILDVTGSMDTVPGIVQAKLPKLHGMIGGVGIPDTQILFGAVGDEFSDRGSAQFGQFESDNRMDDDLEHFWLEGNGGGNNGESYQNAIYFFARHTTIDCWEKRQKKGYCNTPDAPIWMADQTFKPIGEVKPGEKVMGWERLNGYRSLVVTTVEAVQRRYAENVVQVTMQSGRVLRCTDDHQWLSGHHGKGDDEDNDIFTEVTNRYGKGALLSHVIDPIKSLPSELHNEASWLAGIYDGEGSANCISQDQGHNPEVCKRIEETLSHLGFDFNYRKDSYFLLGGLQTYVRILALPITRRKQLLDLILYSKWAKYEYDEGSRPPMMSRTGDRVVKIEALPPQDVISMQTTTHNYIAWGYASSNCFIIGDEYTHKKVTKEAVKTLFGENIEVPSISAEDIIKECQQRYNIFYIIPQHTSHGRNTDIQNDWKRLLGAENVLILENAEDICELIATTMGICEKVVTVDGAKAVLEAAGTSSTVSNKIAVSLVDLAKAKGVDPGTPPKIQRL